MSAPGDRQGVGAFFEPHADVYVTPRVGMRAFHDVTAQAIERALDQTMLCTSGLWNSATIRPRRYPVTVMDPARKAPPVCLPGRRCSVVRGRNRIYD